jgi:hypothetical protein
MRGPSFAALILALSRRNEAQKRENPPLKGGLYFRPVWEPEIR